MCSPDTLRILALYPFETDVMPAACTGDTQALILHGRLLVCLFDSLDVICVSSSPIFKLQRRSVTANSDIARYVLSSLFLSLCAVVVVDSACKLVLNLPHSCFKTKLQPRCTCRGIVATYFLFFIEIAFFSYLFTKLSFWLWIEFGYGSN